MSIVFICDIKIQAFFGCGDVAVAIANFVFSFWDHIENIAQVLLGILS